MKAGYDIVMACILKVQNSAGHIIRSGLRELDLYFFHQEPLIFLFLLAILTVLFPLLPFTAKLLPQMVYNSTLITCFSPSNISSSTEIWQLLSLLYNINTLETPNNFLLITYLVLK